MSDYPNAIQMLVDRSRVFIGNNPKDAIDGRLEQPSTLPKLRIENNDHAAILVDGGKPYRDV